MDKKELWLRLKTYRFDHIVATGLWEHVVARFGGEDASLKAFAGKIAKKHNWTNRFVIRALAEYKKFVYLGLISDFHVTPSSVIDVIWHEHILFSKAYRDFCNNIIEQQFDHHPELLPMTDQTGRFNAQYLDTIALYKTEFDIEPPSDIWGNTKFDKDELKRNGHFSLKKKRNSGDPIYTDTPLYTSFNNDNAADFPEFVEFGAGDYGGAGSSGDWGDSSGSDSDGGGCSGGCGGGGD